MSGRQQRSQGGPDPAVVVVFSVAPLWTPHFGTELELIAEHVEKGDDVRVFHCRGGIPSSMPNPDHDLVPCILCRSQSRRGLRATGLPPEKIAELRPSMYLEGVELPQPTTLRELKGWTFDDADLGEAVASSLVSTLRDPAPSPTAHRELVASKLQAAVGLYLEAISTLRRVRPDLVYVFNGRTATTRPLIRACERLDIRYACHDVGYEIGTYRLVPGGMVHDLETAKRAITRTWASSSLPDEEKRRIGRGFFVGRRSGGEGAPAPEFRFAERQRRGSLPAGFDERARNVAIFNSSEDEFAAIAEYRNPVYADQMEALDAIVTDERLARLHFYLRVHPNLAGLDNEQTRRIAALSGRPNLTIIAADDPVDTYALMEAANTVVTFGSTAGVEALQLGTPTILIGRAAWEDLGCVRPRGHEEVVDAILHPPKEVDVDLPERFGFFQRRGATDFEHFDRWTYYTGAFAGVVLMPGRFALWSATWIRRLELLVRDPRSAMRNLARRLRFGRREGSA